jgi:hypothetical protein
MANSGRPIQATVGHHGDDSVEKAAGTMQIVYDPRHPTDAAPSSSALVTGEDGWVATAPRVGWSITAIAALTFLGLLALTLRTISRRR